MKPAVFDYRRPGELSEALGILAEAGGDARIMAGGQSLVPMMNMRVVSPAVIVDINRMDGLCGIEVQDDLLRVGARVRHNDLLHDPRVARDWPLLPEAIRHVAHPAIRNRGTPCGSVAHNDPSAEAPTILAAYDGTVVLASADGTREVAITDFSQGPLMTDIAEGEMVVELRYRRPPPGTVSAFVEFAKRLGDFAMAGVAVRLQLAAGQCCDVRIVVLGMGDGPFRAHSAEALMRGQPVSASLVAATAETVRTEVQPEGDVLVSAGYRRHLAGVLAARAVNTALSRATGKDGNGGAHAH